MKLKRFDQQVLEAISELGHDAYTLQIRLHVEKRRECWVSIGKFFVHLEAMSERGWIVSESREGGPERGYRPRLLYRLTQRGREALSSARLRESFEEARAKAQRAAPKPRWWTWRPWGGRGW